MPGHWRCWRIRRPVVGNLCLPDSTPVAGCRAPFHRLAAGIVLETVAPLTGLLVVRAHPHRCSAARPNVDADDAGEGEADGGIGRIGVPRSAVERGRGGGLARRQALGPCLVIHGDLDPSTGREVTTSQYDHARCPRPPCLGTEFSPDLIAPS